MKKTKKLRTVFIASFMILAGSISMMSQQVVANESILAEDSKTDIISDVENYNAPNPPAGYRMESADLDSGLVLSEGMQNIYGEEGRRLSAYETSESTSGICGDNAFWNYADGTLTITGTGAIYDYQLSRGYFGEVLVDSPWAGLSDSITSVVVESGITTIGKAAFAALYNVREVLLPDTVTVLGEAVFYNMTDLGDVTIPSGVQVLSSGLFGECTNLKQVTYGNITEIGDYAFQNAPVETITIPASLTKLDDYAFYMSQITDFMVNNNPSYTVMDGVLYRDGGETLYMYPSNKADTQFIIPASVKTVHNYAFAHTKNLKSVDFSNVVTLEDGAFYSSSLTGDLVLSDFITSVGNFTFENSPGITSVTFGTGLAETSYRMFENCTGIKDIKFYGLQKLGMRTFLGCEGLINVTLPDYMTEWGGSVFNSCSNLTTFTAKGLKKVTYADFAQCYALKTVNLSAVERIYREAFYDCKSLETITLPETIQNVSATAFPATTKIICLNTELVPFGQSGFQYAEQVEITGTRDYNKAYEVLELVNNERIAQGLTPLYMDESLLESAMIRAAECSLLFSHTRPDSTLCMTISDKMSGENIAMGQSTASSVMTSWMNSEGHRENILTEEYGSIGIGCFQIDGRYYWTQCFSEEKLSTNCTKLATTKEATLSANLPKETFQEASATSGIIFGILNEYTYQYEVSFANKSLIEGAKTMAKVTLTNPGDYESTTVNINNLTFSTSDSMIAEVDQNGTVTAKKKGTAIITVQGKYFKATAEIKVTSGTENEKKNEKVKNISLSALSEKIAAGKKVEVIADISPENATNKQLKWTTSNPQYATVSEKGVVTTKKDGKGKTVTITAKATDGSGTKTTIKLKLMKNAVTKVKITNSKKTIQTGMTLKLKARVKTDGKNANKSLKWKSSNNAYATVDKNGVVKTQKAGKGKTVTITAMSTDGTNKKAKIKIKIK